MNPMTCKERVLNTLLRKPVDYIPAMISPWSDTYKRWAREGHIKEGEDLVTHFNLDFRSSGWFNGTADLDFVPQVLEEDEDTILTLDGNGAKLRRHKKHDATPEHVDFTVKEREGWEERIKPHLLNVDRRRIDFDAYRNTRELAAKEEKFFFWHGVAPFEQMHPVCGHEHMLYGMAADPDWVKDMVMTYACFTIAHMDALFEEAGLPDGFFFYEDMGFKEKPFMSPALYEEIMLPGHKMLFDYAHERGRQVVVHSCGFVEPLVPGLIRAGMDCLQAMEVKAGMDVRRLADKFGDKIAFYGNIDVRTLISNDRAQIDAEMEAKIPYLMKKGCSYILHSDHSEPPEVDYGTIQYFLERGRELGRRTE